MSNAHYFLKIEGPNVDGESEDKQHEKEIELKGYFFSETQKAKGESGGGQAGGKVRMEDLVIRSETSAASPALFLSCANGQSFKTATLTCMKATGSSGQDWYLKWTLEEVFISEFKHVASEEAQQLKPIEGVTAAALVPLEEIHLSYRSLKMEYRRQKPDGSMGPAIEKCWDRKKNAAC